jgi:uncharacterized protein (DUF2235 family)
MKRLVLCCDGTRNSADQERNSVPSPTNVVKIACRVAKRDDAALQVIYYDQAPIIRSRGVPRFIARRRDT